MSLTQRNTENREKQYRLALSVFGIFMCILYFSAGLFVIFTPQILAGYPQSIRVALGILFMVYSIYRAGRVYQQIRKR